MRTAAPHQQRETKGSLINYIIFINLKLHNEYNLEILLEQIVLRKDKNKIMFNLTEIFLSPVSFIPSHGCPSYDWSQGEVVRELLTEGGRGSVRSSVLHMCALAGKFFIRSNYLLT